MADIGLKVSDINIILNSVLSQAKLSPATVVDTSSFISVAQTALKTAPEQTLQALGQVLSQRSIVSIRPYERKFKNLERLVLVNLYLNNDLNILSFLFE